MPDIRLQDYVTKIKDMIRQDRHDDALAHCQHILSLYPKHIETYCLLGEACLEKEMYREAIEFFQRTLSADPESFIARVGLGIICDEQGALPEAIWHMERAFELAPGNAEVRRELQRLYTQRDGKEKARLKLTRGALGRLYVRNGLFERAIGEFRTVLRQEPDLPDIHVALVEALWREGRRLEAVETCLELLEALPNCLKANLILAEIWMRGGHEDASEEKLNLARALDPENLVAQEMMGRDSPLPQEDVIVPELVEMPVVPSLVPTEEVDVPTAAAWGVIAKEFDAVEEPPAAEAVEEWEAEEELPDWLREMGMTEIEEPAPGLEFDVEAEEVVPGEELPDWLRELTGEEEIPATEEFAPPPGEEMPAAEEIPAWLQELEEAEAVGVRPPVEGPQVEEEIPDWLGELELPEAEEAALPPIVEAPAADEETPDWLRELEEPAVEAVVEAPAEAPIAEEEIPAEEIPDWLRELEEPAVERVAELPPTEAPAVEVPVAEEEAPAEEIPDWLQELEEPAAVIAPPEKAPPVESVAPPTAAVPASLLALVAAGILDETDLESAMAEMSPEELDAQRAEEVPVWLQDLVVEEPTLPEAEAAVVEEVKVEEVAPAEEIPDWRKELAEPQVAETPKVPVAEEEIPTEEVPAWLRELEGPIAEPVAEAPEIPVAEEEIPTEEVPDWLRDLGAPTVEEVAAPPLAEAPEVERVAPVEEPVAEVPVVTLEEEAIPPAAEVPESLWDLMEAGILDEADLEAAMAEISPEELAEQQAEEVPAWLQELMGEEPTLAEEVAAPPLAEAAVVEEAVRVEEEAPPEEIPDWLRDLEAPPVEEVAAPPLAEAAVVEEAMRVEEEAPPLAEAAVVEEAVRVEEEAPPEEIPAWLPEIEEIAVPPITEIPKEMIPVAEAISPIEEAPPAAEVAPPVEEIPESLRALVTAGILDEADLESVMAEMSPKELEEQRAEQVPTWLQELVDEEIAAPPIDQMPSAEEELPTEEIPDWLRELEEPEVEERVPTLAAAPPPVEEEIVAEEIAPAPVAEALIEKVAPPPVVEAPEPEEPAPPTDMEMVAPFERVEVEEEIAQPTRLDELRVYLESRPRDYKVRLELAQAFRDEREWNTALDHYERLISARKFLPVVIKDLQALSEEKVNQARLYQLLGDAHVQEDHLEEALAMYRRARKALVQR